MNPPEKESKKEKNKDKDKDKDSKKEQDKDKNNKDIVEQICGMCGIVMTDQIYHYLSGLLDKGDVSMEQLIEQLQNMNLAT